MEDVTSDRMTNVIIVTSPLAHQYKNTRPNYTLTDFNGLMQIENIIDNYLLHSDTRINVILSLENENIFGITNYLQEKYPLVNIITTDRIGETYLGTARQNAEQLNLHNGEPIIITNCAVNAQINQSATKSFFAVNEQNEVLGIIRYEDYQTFISGTAEEAEVIDFYEDYRTFKAWTKANDKSTIFCDIDGTIIVAQKKGKYMEDPIPLTNRINQLLKESQNGSKIIFTTARPKKDDERTTQMLQKLGFTDFMLVSGLMNAKRVIINDYTDATPAPRAIAINVKRDSDSAPGKL